MAEFFYQGKSIPRNSSGTGINPGWGETSGGVTGGEKYKPVPESVTVNWRCGLDLINYKGGMKLPRDKMLELFKEGTIDSYDGRHPMARICNPCLLHIYSIFSLQNC